MVCVCEVEWTQIKQPYPWPWQLSNFKLIHTLKQRVSNNKHPPYKYANQAYILQWVQQWRMVTDHPPINVSLSSDNGWILENESALSLKQRTRAPVLGLNPSPLRVLVRMSGFTNPWRAIASNLCDLFTVHFREFSWSDTPPKICLLRISPCQHMSHTHTHLKKHRYDINKYFEIVLIRFLVKRLMTTLICGISLA